MTSLKVTMLTVVINSEVISNMVVPQCCDLGGIY